MAFTVPAEWQYIDGTHQVAPRAPIVGGKTGSYAFDALIADHHLVRASRMPAVLAMANTDAWTTTAGPGSGVGSWASFGKVKFETQAGFDGRLNVTAWAQDCQGGAGGVYVAVFNTSSVLQASATLTNTSSGTKQELTGSITGLSASTEYLIEVRFAARTAGSPTAMLYGVLVEPRALTSSTIDDKLDDQRAKDDESASALLPYRIRENLIASMRERMPQCAHVYPDESKIQMSAPEVSTHPDEWWGIPIVVPVPRGAVEVGVRIVYEVATASVKARLRVIGGDIGSAVTLSTTGSTTLSSDLTVAVRSGDSRSALVMLSFQSTRGSAVAVANGATSADGLASRKVALSLLSGSVTAHSVIQNAGSSKPATYIGSVSGGTNITIWPERWPIADIFGGSVYTLGKIKLHSVGVEVKADASSLRLFCSDDSVHERRQGHAIRDDHESRRGVVGNLFGRVAMVCHATDRGCAVVVLRSLRGVRSSGSGRDRRTSSRFGGNRGFAPRDFFGIWKPSRRNGSHDSSRQRRNVGLDHDCRLGFR